jgi:hypothetical protein
MVYVRLLKRRSFESVNGTEGYDGFVKPTCRILAITLLSITGKSFYSHEVSTLANMTRKSGVPA